MGEQWPVHVVVLQFARDPDTDDPINWDWTTLIDSGTPVAYVTGGVLGHVDEELIECRHPDCRTEREGEVRMDVRAVLDELVGAGHVDTETMLGVMGVDPLELDLDTTSLKFEGNEVILKRDEVEVIESPSGWSFRASQENGDEVDCAACGDALNDDHPIVNDAEGYAYHEDCLGVEFDEVVRRLEAEGITAYVEQTGGGTATIYVGEATEDEHGDRRFPCAVGPGWFEGPGWTLGGGHNHDLYVGPDNDTGELPSYGAFSPDNPATVEAVVDAVKRVLGGEW
jgi:hypothetical protein